MLRLVRAELYQDTGAEHDPFQNLCCSDSRAAGIAAALLSPDRVLQLGFQLWLSSKTCHQQGDLHTRAGIQCRILRCKLTMHYLNLRGEEF